MKAIKYTLSTLLAIAMLLGCKKPTEGFELIVGTNFAEATASFQFFDSKSGEQIGLDNSAEVNVEILGEDADKIVDNSGSSNIEVTQGFLTLATKKGITVSVDDPIEVRMKITADGYLDQFFTFYMDAIGTQHIEISMENLNDLSENVSLKTESFQVDGSGATQSAVSFATPDAQSGDEQIAISVEVPQGTVMKDKNGNAVSGNVSAQLVQVAQHNGTPAHSLPNGGMGTIDGKTGNYYLESTSFLHLDMYAGGTEVTNFDSPIQTKVELNPDTKDINGQPISVGSEVEIFSFDEEANQYVSEGTAIVALNAQQRFEVTVNMSHLSIWTIAYSVVDCTPSLGYRVQFKFANVEVVPYQINSYSISNQLLASIRGSFNVSSAPGGLGSSVSSDFTIEHLVPPPYYSTTVSTGFDFITETHTNPICGTTKKIDLSGLDLGQITPVSLTVNAKCANNPGQTIRPTLTCYVKEAGTTRWLYAGEMTNGKITTSVLKSNTNYQVAVQIGKKFYISDETYTNDKTDYVFDQTIEQELCNLLN